jgi:hypothetical protein
MALDQCCPYNEGSYLVEGAAMSVTQLVVTGAVLAAGVATCATAPQSDVASAKGEEVLTIVGCVQGSRLKPLHAGATGEFDTVTNTLRAAEYMLDGPKDLLKTLTKNHDGHIEEVTGVVKIPPTTDQPDVHVRTTDVGGKTRVTIGTRTGPTPNVMSSTPASPRLSVQSFKHVADKCAQK